MRTLNGPVGIVILLVLAAAACFHLWLGSIGILEVRLMRAWHLTFLLPLAFLVYPAFSNSPTHRPSWPDLLWAVAALMITFYVVVNAERLDGRLELVSKIRDIEVWLGTLAIVVVLEATRRVVGTGMAVVFTVSVLYLFFGQILPEPFGHRPIAYNRVVERIYLLENQGIFGSLVGISVSYLFLFVLFGSFVERTGIGAWFAEVSKALLGHTTGGPAKIAVFNSALFGSISGSPTANVYGTGVYTIPLMKQMGYRPAFAAAVEAAASTGGQIMPPVMGASVFIMMALLGITYLDVITAALPSALLFFLAMMTMVHLEARRAGIRPLSRSELPSRLGALKRSYFLAPILALLIVLYMGYSPVKGALAGIVVAFVLSFATRDTWMTPRRLLDTLAMGTRAGILIAVACTSAGVIVSALTATGLGLSFSTMVVSVGHGSLFISLIMVGVTALLLGMGMPTTPAYILAVTIAAPALIDMGVAPLSAHMFVFYYAIVSGVTPPVAITAYAAAGIAGASPLRAGVDAFKLSAGAFIVPFMFVYHPILLLQGDAVDFLPNFIAALAGIVAIAAALVGYLRRPLPITCRTLMLAGGLLMIIPDLLLTMIGLACFLPVVVQQWHSPRFLCLGGWEAVRLALADKPAAGLPD